MSITVAPSLLARTAAGTYPSTCGAPWRQASLQTCAAWPPLSSAAAAAVSVAATGVVFATPRRPWPRARYSAAAPRGAAAWRRQQRRRSATAAAAAAVAAPAENVAQAPAPGRESAAERKYEVREVEGKGLGVFALSDLVAGELVIADTPVELSRDDAGGKRAEFDEHPDISRTNHSCNPNCQSTWNEVDEQMQLYACTNITAGEELCHDYVDVRAPQAQRQEDLWARPEGFRFQCLCLSCAAPSAKSDGIRSQMQMLNANFVHGGDTDPAKRMQLLADLLLLYDEEGLHLPRHRKTACYYAYQLALKAEDVTSAGQWVAQAYHWAKLGTGPRHPDAQLLCSYKDDPTSHPIYAAGQRS